jgi:hypothetical protein
MLSESKLELSEPEQSWIAVRPRLRQNYAPRGSANAYTLLLRQIAPKIMYRMLITFTVPFFIHNTKICPDVCSLLFELPPLPFL